MSTAASILSGVLFASALALFLLGIRRGGLKQELNRTLLRDFRPKETAAVLLLCLGSLALHMAIASGIRLISGAKETLEELQVLGAEHFVYTHRGSSSVPILKRLEILDCFREVVTSEYGLAKKPSGEGVRYLLGKYNLDPEKTWYVGDRTLDVLCAKDAGVRALLYLEPDTCVSATGREDRIVHDLREIAAKQAGE